MSKHPAIAAADDLDVFHHEFCEFAWMNGKIVRNADTHMSPQTHSQNYGGAPIEGIRVYSGNVFVPTPHMQRLLDGAKQLGYKNIPYTVADLVQACKDLVEENGLKDGYIRAIIFRGPEDLYVARDKGSTHVLMTYFPLPSILEGDQRLKTCSMRRPPANCMHVHTKSSQVFVVGAQARREAEDAGFTDGLILDYRDFLADSSAANFMLVYDGPDGPEVHMPTDKCSLAGITQGVFVVRFKQRGIKVVARDIHPDEIATALGMGMCGTAAEYAHVVQWEDVEIPIHDILAKAKQDFIELVHKSNDEVDEILGTTNGGDGLFDGTLAERIAA